MKSSVTKEFLRRLHSLPLEIQELAQRTYILWRSHPFICIGFGLAHAQNTMSC
jgi:hypothetical protein